MINFVKAKRSLKIDGTKTDMYVAKIYRAPDTSLDTVAQEISHATTLAYPDVMAALKAFEIHVANHVMEGSAVKFGTLGAFIPAIHSKAVKNSEDVDASIVKRVACRFFPSRNFYRQLKKASLEYKDLSKIKHV
ncbi:MAG: hypothetical protein IJ250_05485 [Bacteroidales bacterium]|nr:hypothetical protein [Bacteroidales bacterium]MBQ7985073.1 hypothetical protein [Bacteroidales bacterium]